MQDHRQSLQLFQQSKLLVGIVFNDELSIELIPRPRNNADCLCTCCNKSDKS